MMVLAQLVDPFGQNVLCVLQIIVVGGPPMGFLIGCLLGGWNHARKRWIFLACYYGLWAMPVAFTAAGTTPPDILEPIETIEIWLGLLLAPCLSIILMIPARDSARGSKSESQ
jgi:hypothetical protein